MSYGFDPSELFETKIDLIDKDGFHGVGEASDGGNSSGGVTDQDFLADGLLVFRSKVSKALDNNQETEFPGLDFVISFNEKDFPILFDHRCGSHNIALYFGDPVDDSEITYDDEYHRPEHSTVKFYTTELGGEYVVGYIGGHYLWFRNLTQYDPIFYTVEEGTPVHIVGLFSKNPFSFDPIILQIHTTWRIL